MSSGRPAILDWTWEEFLSEGERFLEAQGEPRYRVRQIAKWIYERTPAAFREMSDLPERLRERLEASYTLHPLGLELEQVSRDGTRKFLWKRGPSREGSGSPIESVVIPEKDRVTYCISSQAGCPVKCPFCATGHGGFQGQLSAAEIIDQVLEMRRLGGSPPTNIVFMGMGEPLLNFGEVTRALRILTSPRQLAVGARRVTVSTVGVPERMLRLSELFPQVKIALSLHAARDELRDELVPLNTRYPLGEVLGAVREITRLTHRLVTIEYVILPGVNDTDEDADDLAMALEGLPVRVNLIGFNPFEGAAYEKPSVGRLIGFRRRLARGFPGPVTIRRARGEDIEGACGQLTLRRG